MEGEKRVEKSRFWNRNPHKKVYIRLRSQLSNSSNSRSSEAQKRMKRMREENKEEKERREGKLREK